MRSTSWLVVGLTGGVLVAGGVLLGVQGLGTPGTAAALTPEPVRRIVGDRQDLVEVVEALHLPTRSPAA